MAASVLPRARARTVGPPLTFRTRGVGSRTRGAVLAPLREGRRAAATPRAADAPDRMVRLPTLLVVGVEENGARAVRGEVSPLPAPVVRL
jgi:hypothetical protein